VTPEESVAKSRAMQGLPGHIEDPAAIRRVAALLIEGKKKASPANGTPELALEVRRAHVERPPAA
jgi:hypothetical protein